jgi:hypothetical protein
MTRGSYMTMINCDRTNDTAKAANYNSLVDLDFDFSRLFFPLRVLCVLNF